MVSKKEREKSLKLAKEYRDLLLYSVTGGNMGKEPKVPITQDIATFSEKKSLLAEMIKIAELDIKNSEDQEDTSGFERLRKQIDAGRKNGSGGNNWGIPESGADDSSSISSSDSSEA